MKILNLKRVFYLFVTLAAVGVLVTSCERDIIIEDDIDGFKEIIIEDDLEGVKEIIIEEDLDRVNLIASKSINVKHTQNEKKGKEVLFLHYDLLNEYYNHAVKNKRLDSKERIKIIEEVTEKDLYNCPSCVPFIEDGVYSFHRIFSSVPCIPNRTVCHCRDQWYDEYLWLYDIWLAESTYLNCTNMVIAQCNFNIAAANCDNGEGPIEDCEQFYEVCYSNPPSGDPFPDGPIEIHAE